MGISPHHAVKAFFLKNSRKKELYIVSSIQVFSALAGAVILIGLPVP
jgi:hypothetical protein